MKAVRTALKTQHSSFNIHHSICPRRARVSPHEARLFDGLEAHLSARL